MSGSNNGTGQPITFKCAKCKLTRNTLGNGKIGDPHLTGRQRLSRTIHVGRSARMSNTFREYECFDCGHIGWSRHKDTQILPLVSRSAVTPRKPRSATR